MSRDEQKKVREILASLVRQFSSISANLKELGDILALMRTEEEFLRK